MENEILDKQRQEFEVMLDELARADRETFQRGVVDCFRGFIRFAEKMIEDLASERDELLKVLSNNRDIIDRELNAAADLLENLQEELIDVQMATYCTTVAFALKMGKSLSKEGKAWLAEQYRIDLNGSRKNVSEKFPVLAKALL